MPGLAWVLARNLTMAGLRVGLQVSESREQYSELLWQVLTPKPSPQLTWAQVLRSTLGGFVTLNLASPDWSLPSSHLPEDASHIGSPPPPAQHHHSPIPGAPPSLQHRPWFAKVSTYIRSNSRSSQDLSWLPSRFLN
jgi:hypothetical protein